MLLFFVKARPYWAKDLIFLITDMDYIGTQAFVNSYFDIKSSCTYFTTYKNGFPIKSENRLKF